MAAKEEFYEKLDNTEDQYIGGEPADEGLNHRDLDDDSLQNLMAD